MIASATRRIVNPDSMRWKDIRYIHLENIFQTVNQQSFTVTVKMGRVVNSVSDCQP